jgi:hypothetical protein
MKFILMMSHPGKVPYQITRWKPAEITGHIAFMKQFAAKLNEGSTRRARICSSAPGVATRPLRPSNGPPRRPPASPSGSTSE